MLYGNVITTLFYNKLSSLIFQNVGSLFPAQPFRQALWVMGTTLSRAQAAAIKL